MLYKCFVFFTGIFSISNWSPSKRQTLFITGLPHTTLGQHWISIGSNYPAVKIGLLFFKAKKQYLPFGFADTAFWLCMVLAFALQRRGGGPRVVVSTAAFHARVRGSVPGLGGLKETKLFLPHPRVYCGEPPWPRGSVLGLRPPGLEFRILCLDDSVISIISPSSGGSPGPV